MLGSEVLLYGYGMICVSMLIFNIIYFILLNKNDKRLARKKDRFTEKIETQLNLIREGDGIDPEHITYLQRKLSYVGNLLAFDHMMEEQLMQEDDPVVREYYRQIEPVILHLATVYQKRENVQAAYYAYFLSKCKLEGDTMLMEPIQRILVEYMKKDSLHCRVNALQALYNFGSADKILDAIILLDAQETFLHEKILTDGLLSFTGDHALLISLLWKRFDEFSNKTQLSILNYIRFKTGDFCEEMLAIMQDTAADKELRLSAIRYFGKYPYAPAKELLLKFASDKEPANWEYAAISITSLARYTGDDVVDVLLAGIHSSNWYVRNNAASSLDAHRLEYSDLITVVGGNDRYAREMMLYRLESRKMEKKKQEVRA